MGFISLGIPSLSFVRGKFPPDFAFYIRRPGRTILLHLQAPESCRNSKFSHFHEPRMPPEFVGVAVEAKEAEAKDFLTLQSGKKENSPPSTRNSSWRKLHQVLDEPPNANQERAGVG